LDTSESRTRGVGQAGETYGRLIRPRQPYQPRSDHPAHHPWPDW